MHCRTEHCLLRPSCRHLLSPSRGVNTNATPNHDQATGTPRLSHQVRAIHAQHWPGLHASRLTDALLHLASLSPGDAESLLSEAGRTLGGAASAAYASTPPQPPAKPDALDLVGILRASLLQADQRP